MSQAMILLRPITWNLCNLHQMLLSRHPRAMETSFCFTMLRRWPHLQVNKNSRFIEGFASIDRDHCAIWVQGKTIFHLYSQYHFSNATRRTYQIGKHYILTPLIWKVCHLYSVYFIRQSIDLQTHHKSETTFILL